MKWGYFLLPMLTLTAHTGHVGANSLAPWGSAPVIQQTYSKQKVVFDTTSGTTAGLTSVLDRASLISILNGADPLDNKIVIVLHGGAIPFFAIKNYAQNKRQGLKLRRDTPFHQVSVSGAHSRSMRHAGLSWRNDVAAT